LLRGEAVLLDASGLYSDHEAFVRLSQANLIILVVQAGVSTIAVVDNALGVLCTAFRNVDGVIVNRQRPQVLRWPQR